MLRAGPFLCVGPLEKQWARDRGPRLFTCGQRLEAVVTEPRRGVGSSCGLYAFQKFCEENRTTFDLSGVVSLLALLLARRHHGRVSGQCRVCHRQLRSPANEVGLKEHSETLKLLGCRLSSPRQE